VLGHYTTPPRPLIITAPLKIVNLTKLNFFVWPTSAIILTEVGSVENLELGRIIVYTATVLSQGDLPPSF
jgi:hypothetical protein